MDQSFETFMSQKNDPIFTWSFVALLLLYLIFMGDLKNTPYLALMGGL